MAFSDDVTAALQTQTTAIDNAAARFPAPVDPTTIIPVAEQQSVVTGIAANTAKIDALGK